MRRLFPADQPEERMESILRGDYPRPSELRADVTAELDDAVMKALERSPDARFATISEFSKALEDAPRAARRDIGEWVADIARVALAERTRMVARLENWSDGPQIPLSSSPFASEMPPPIREAGPLEADHIATALRENLAITETALVKASARGRRSSSLIWILIAAVVAGVVGYLSHR